jgi:hypothetical protein
MATTPASSISGVVSGIKSRELVGQLRAVEAAARLSTAQSQTA